MTLLDGKIALAPGGVHEHWVAASCAQAFADAGAQIALTDQGAKAEPSMQTGGTILTMTHYGGEIVVDNYSIMGPVTLASDGVRGVTGDVVHVDGGLHVRA